MNKPNLLLVHSFPTNSILLDGLTDFLSDYFNVIFVNLPGFHKSCPPFKGEINLQKFSDYLDKTIKELECEEYFIGGISFGFLVVNNAKLDKRCKGILAMEPYLGAKYLSISFWKQRKYEAITNVLDIINKAKIEKQIWTSKMYKEFIKKETDYPEDRINIIIEHIDPKTFFTVLRLLMNYDKKIQFHKLPHFLMGNFADDTINFKAVTETFLKNLHDLYIISTPIEHYPKNMTKTYFKKHISEKDIGKIILFLKSNK